MSEIPESVPSKWDQFDDIPNSVYSARENDDGDDGNSAGVEKKATSEVILKRAENAIFQTG
jgi:hypothetical protein